MLKCTRRAVLGAGLAAILSGCGWSGGQDDETTELPMPKADPVPVAQVERLELNLQVGDRFPLMKTVSQELHQSSAIGPGSSYTRLELLLTLMVEEVLEDRKRLGVRYNRVRYSQDVAGEKFDFDSSVHRGPIPKAALPYQGLVGNGFSFWIGRDNQIIEPIGFDAFLERCVRDVPQEHRRDVLARFSQTTADEGIANFVDDSIGLLPYDVGGKQAGSSVAEGDTWARESRLLQPMPLYLKTRYTLRELSPQVAEIEILGTVSPSTTTDGRAPENSDAGKVVPAGAEATARKDPATSPDVVVRGGNTIGSCTIDRGTGLPLRSHVERFLDMSVRLPNGLEFEQRKRTATTIQAFPQQRVGSSSDGDGNEPASPLVISAPTGRPSGPAVRRTEPDLAPVPNIRGSR